MIRKARMLALAGGVALTTTIALIASPAAAATTTTPVNFDCRAVPSIGSPEHVTLGGTVQGDAPETVAAGSTFETVLAPDPMTVLTEAGGHTVRNIRNLRLTVAVSNGAALASAALTGGSGLGTEPPTLTQAGNAVTVTVPGPLAGGATFQLPALHMTLTASGTAGTAVTTHVAGTSYDDPGLTFIAKVKVLVSNVDVPTSCFPNPSPTLTTTTIQ